MIKKTLVFIALFLGLFLMNCSNSSSDDPEPPSSSSSQVDVPSSSSDDTLSSSSLQVDALSSSSDDTPSSSSSQVDAPLSSSDDTPLSSSLQVDASSSSSDDTPLSSSLQGTLKAQPAAASSNPSEPKILVSWTDGEKNYYVIDAGVIRNTFISAIFGPEHYDGYHQVPVSIKNITTSTVTTSTTETVSKSIAISNTLGVKLGLEEAIKTGIPGIGDLSAKLNLEISETVNVSNGRTTSTSLNNIESYVNSQEISRTMTFGSNGAPEGFYRYALYGVSDVYFVISTSLDNQTLLSWEVISCVRPDGYLRHMDYSSDGNFDNSPISGNEIVFAEDFHKTLLKPTLSRIKKTETKEFTVSGSYTFDKSFPATIEVYAIGAGGGGQGGHENGWMWDGGPNGSGHERGTGGAGGGGAAAYIKFNLEQSTIITITVGKGGTYGSGSNQAHGWANHDNSWASGTPGSDGGNTTVQVGSTILTANGGKGGGGVERTEIHGGNGGTASKPPEVPEANWATAPGNKGTDGIRNGDQASIGGNSGRLIVGSSDIGGIRGGSGGASPYGNNPGSVGLDGEVKIVVTYYE